MQIRVIFTHAHHFDNKSVTCNKLTISSIQHYSKMPIIQREHMGILPIVLIARKLQDTHFTDLKNNLQTQSQYIIIEKTSKPPVTFPRHGLGSNYFQIQVYAYIMFFLRPSL